ncbi:carboxypeptidase-like regulatory domain-containing protein [Tenacibaculum sp. M341]|uniref:carboxypeptidase-like regulatory domain-containing protein n=1 Tax=Tenacibaculum sp. M341 TaxID=2530339 RepID=UPI0010462CB6|nr:carboxypeptidase-like regulatory domain-containing protein [Tenacibaculum sp. M341]TCI85092.1 hypothetical protein EYW44_18230 [Tenacibaculum sp. M341]
MKLTFILSLFALTITAQSIKGTIIDSESKKPLENVTVFFEKENTGSVSNNKGVYILNTISKIRKNDVIRFSLIGYDTQKITLSELQKLNFTINLIKKIENLDEVIVSSEKKLKTRIDYKKLSNLNKGVYNVGTALVGDKIYLVGGNLSYSEDVGKIALRTLSENSSPNDIGRLLRDLRRPSISYKGYNEDLQLYDILKDSCYTSDLKFRARTNNNIVAIKNQLYILGGKMLSKKKTLEYLDNKIEILDLNLNTVKIDHTNPHQAINFASFAHENYIITMGGSIKEKEITVMRANIKVHKGNKKVYTNKAHIYDTNTGYWYDLTNMLSAKETQGVLVNNKIYLIGGFNGKALDDIESYNLVTGKWKKEGNLFEGIKKPGLTSHNNKIYIFDNQEIVVYDTNENSLASYKINLNVKNAKMHCHENNLYIIAGYIDENYTKSPSTGIYKIAIEEFSNTKVYKSKNLNNTDIN